LRFEESNEITQKAYKSQKYPSRFDNIGLVENSAKNIRLCKEQALLLNVIEFAC
jgi:hypothetical protein